MRDDQINLFAAALRRASLRHPDERLGQLLFNAWRHWEIILVDYEQAGIDVFNATTAELIMALARYGNEP